MRIIDSPAYRRHLRCRHALTLDLYTRTGSFWEHVVLMRRKWGVTAEERIPPRRTGGNPNNPWQSPDGFYYPKAWPEPPEAPSDPLLREGYELVRRGDWWADMSALVVNVVPAEHLGDGLFRADAFTNFVASCVLYDPPRDALLDFAVAALVLVTLPPVSSADLRGNSATQANAVAMFQPPIVARRDPNAVKQTLTDWYEALIAAMADSLRKEGFDLYALRRRLNARPEYSEKRLAAELQKLANEHYIKVREETVQEEVVGAYKLIRARYPGPLMKKDERTELICVQVALWRAAGRSEESIAVHFGRKVQRPDVEAPRSKMVRDCARRGRAILEERGLSV